MFKLQPFRRMHCQNTNKLWTRIWIESQRPFFARIEFQMKLLQKSPQARVVNGCFVATQPLGEAVEVLDRLLLLALPSLHHLRKIARLLHAGLENLRWRTPSCDKRDLLQITH